FSSADGNELHGWYCPVDNPRAVVLFAHGNSGNIADRSEILKKWTEQLGVTVLAFDYRGYGHSKGEPSELGLFADTRGARRFLAERAGVNELDIVLYGRSLGGAVMVDLASNDGARALILESTFTSLPDVANWKLPYTRIGSLLENRFTSIEKIARYDGPILITHGSEDTLIPIAQGRELFAAANDPKQFVAIPNAEHNWAPPVDYLKTVNRFIDNL
ncbi:MAG: alpha/beta hydrolase, partial [Aeoliella sp.]